ncbi:MAG: DUF5916 domain-containing protein [Gemmatimonadota bacterium]|nr:DUF5916 domain-containing protein [Gemmatimonadota bacterium]
MSEKGARVASGGVQRRTPADALHAAAPMPESLRIDGVIDEPAWENARVFTDFVQEQPVEGAPVEHETEVRVLFGDGAIWVAARMWDSEPDRIVAQLDRRDDRGQSDTFSMHLDPNLDGLTGYMFGISAANVQRDMYMYDDDQLDGAWDAVWTSSVRIDDQGWTAEFRIPLSQIRYEASEEPQAWGINFFRERSASAERSYYSLVSQLRRGRVSQMGRMEGVRVTRPSRRLEVLPYAVASMHRGPAEPGDPFFSGSAATSRVGADVSYGLGAAFTLDATVNPDFGQVEADPAVINLSAFETFFDEQRPFFVEDARIFDFGLSGGRNQLFYSRRIGRSPSGDAPGDPTFTDIPDNTSILGAAKLAGRTSSGLSVGVLGAVTGAETGRSAFEDGAREEFLVEPRAEYGVLSLAQDFNGGTTQIRGMGTAMRRDLPGDGAFDWLPSSAFNGGLRFEHQWNDREWALWGFLAGSHVRGDEEAITRIQRASNHYFQRPDATRFALDPTARSMSGAEWRLQFERRTGDHWTGAIWAAEVTKGFEINETGFSGTAERVDGGFRVGYREIQPGDLFRNYNVTFSTFHNWSHEAFDDTWSLDSWKNARTGGSYNVRGHAELLNYWGLRANASYRPRQMSRSRTRGGPMMVVPASTSLRVNVDSDRRKAVSFGTNMEVSSDRRGDGGSYQIGGNLRVRPSNNVEVSVSPRFESSRSTDQYVTTVRSGDFEPTYGNRYLFADLERRSFSMEGRVNWTFTPDVSLQVFAQPLLSSGDYVRYKQLGRAESFDFDAFVPGTGHEVGGDVRCDASICELDGTQHVDFDGDGTADHAFTDRDFNFRSLIGNAVLRWEYRPGSTVFFVWQRQQSQRAAVGDFDLRRDTDALFGLPADNRFIIKVNYWLGI